MTKKAATAEAVEKAINGLLAAGKPTTLDAIQELVGGNKATIAIARSKILTTHGDASLNRCDPSSASALLPEVQKIAGQIQSQLQKLTGAYAADLERAIAEERAKARADIEFATKELRAEIIRLKADNAEVVGALEIAEIQAESFRTTRKVEELLKTFEERPAEHRANLVGKKAGEELAVVDAAKPYPNTSPNSSDENFDQSGDQPSDGSDEPPQVTTNIEPDSNVHDVPLKSLLTLMR